MDTKLGQQRAASAALDLASMLASSMHLVSRPAWNEARAGLVSRPEARAGMTMFACTQLFPAIH